MADTAAFLMDRVIPRVPVRQWVLTFPRPIRFVLARDSKLLSRAIRIHVEEIFRDYRRRLEVRGGGKGECGAITGVQRFGGALNLNVHLHTPVLDGAYVTDPKTGAIGFRRAPPPTREDLERVLGRTRRRVLAFLARKGHVWEDGEEGAEEDPTSLDLAQAASIRHWVGVAGGPGRPVPILGKREACHAEAPFGEEVRRREKLAALVPPPRSHLMRYHGILAPHAKKRERVIPPESPDRPPRCDRPQGEEKVGSARRRRRRERTKWADLLKRSMGLDVLECPRCKGRMDLIACIADPPVIGRILRAMGLPDEAPRVFPARPPPQGEFDFVQESVA